ncbi:M23 family metallopeptidase [Bdellovibrio sp. SKB1291214]|uniref:M23 family metallopeptidase n=1 Tax=Bdellovibrio sp. SKB1291214 TaxID=1732569 RepID=UPI0020CF1525|nr:M23 family metallopeptidase [Bdellovibrio sp. SKB1291214]UYL10669.1 M23 family metallopeptidase [Bdellovibrio sp. SKB1291214]
MNLHLARIMCTIVLVLTSYQSVHAGANNFTAKQIRSGDNLISILRQQGFSAREREKVLGSDLGLRRLFLTLDTRYLVRRDKNEVELKVFDSQTSEAFRILKKNGAIQAGSYNPKFKTTYLRIDGKVHGSILGSILPKINSNWVATRFMDAYAFDIRSPKNLRRGAPFWFTVEKKYEDGLFVKYGEILQTSLEINGEEVHKKFVRSKGGGVFFNDQDLQDKRAFYSPVNYIKIASTFQPNRLHPITRRRVPHLGVDFELPIGDSVLAARKGVVVRYGNNHAAGNYIVLRHSNSIETSYNHLYKIDRRIREGLVVNTGDKIAEVGCTGYCTRAHLHFAIKIKGRMVDPLKYIKSYPQNMHQMLASQVAKN